MRSVDEVEDVDDRTGFGTSYSQNRHLYFKRRWSNGTVNLGLPSLCAGRSRVDGGTIVHRAGLSDIKQLKGLAEMWLIYEYASVCGESVHPLQCE